MTESGSTVAIDTTLTGRRSALKLGAAAWSAPAIVALAAAPAAAASGALTFVSGTTRSVASGNFYDVVFTNASVICSGRILANELTLTVTFSPSSGNGQIFKDSTNPTGWTSSSTNGSTSLVYRRTAASNPGVPVAFPNGTYFGTNNAVQEGTFLLTFAAPGATSTSFTVSTQGARAARTAGRAGTGTR